MNLFIGLISGTSMDGVDAALVDLDQNKLIHGLTKPYKENTKKCLKTLLSNEKIKPFLLSQLNTCLGVEFAEATTQLLQEAKINSQSIKAIGSHGQTIFHDTAAKIPYTLQLGCPHIIAAHTGITVVADFRTRDLILGGQGAPFAPLYHQALFADRPTPLAVVNIGGISNVSFLIDGKVKGYDVGPGNCLLDLWVKKHLSLNYDANGEWAATGKIIPELLENLMNDAYFEETYPKSIGKEYFAENWLKQFLLSHYVPADVQATLLFLTADTISREILSYPKTIKEVFICGGGVHNLTLMQAITERLSSIVVNSTAILGINPDFIEAMMFAWLAEKTITKTPVDFTAITGAKSPAIYGAIYFN